MLNTIKQEIKKAMVEKDTFKRNTLKLVLSKAQGYAKDELREVSNEDVSKAIASELKQTKQAQSIVTDKNSDFYHHNEKVIELLLQYSPKQLTEDEIKKEIIKIAETVGLEKKILMPTVMKKLRNIYNGKELNKLVNSINDWR